MYTTDLPKFRKLHLSVSQEVGVLKGIKTNALAMFLTPEFDVSKSASLTHPPLY